MTDKTEALAKLTALEEEAKKLRAILEAPDVVSLLPSIEDMFGTDIYSLYGNRHALYAQRSVGNMVEKHLCLFEGENYFETQEQAQAYAEAFETLILLRRQPGTVVPIDGKIQFSFDFLVKGGLVVGNYTEAFKKSLLSPNFDTKENAEKALETVGADRILRMYNTLHHTGD